MKKYFVVFMLLIVVVLYAQTSNEEDIWVIDLL